MQTLKEVKLSDLYSLKLRIGLQKIKLRTENQVRKSDDKRRLQKMVEKEENDSSETDFALFRQLLNSKLLNSSKGGKLDGPAEGVDSLLEERVRCLNG